MEPTGRRRRLLTIGLDAVEAPVVMEMIAAGRAPNLAALESRGLSVDVQAPCMALLPGAIWQDLLTGRHAGDHGSYYTECVHTGEGAVRPVDPHALVGSYYFELAARAGRKVVAIDLPLVASFPGPDGLTLVAEWHVHDAVWGRATNPPDLLADLEHRFGVRPYDRCDLNHGESESDLGAFAEMLVSELCIKVDMIEHVLTTHEWDHAVIGLSQGHCAGHQLWALHQQSAATGDPFSSPMAQVYAALDRAVGRLIEVAGPDCDLVVVTSHGMSDYIGGPQLLPVLMERWGYGNPRPHLSAVRRLLPRSLIDRSFKRWPRLRAAVSDRGVLAARLGPDTRAVAVPNNRVGAVRLNIAGREPDGLVTEVEGELVDLERRLMGLRHVETGEPIIERVVRPADVYGPDHHPDLPDLLVEFRRDLGPLTAAICPEIGRVDVASQRAYYPRTGDHSDASRLWIDHRGVTELAPMRTSDVAATLLALLDVPLPDGIDGRVAVGLRNPVAP